MVIENKDCTVYQGKLGFNSDKWHSLRICLDAYISMLYLFMYVIHTT